MWVNKNAKTIKEEGYSYVLNLCLKVGTHIFSIGTATENYMVYEDIITDEFGVDSSGYITVVLQGVDTNIRIVERIELLVCSLHEHKANFLTREEAEEKRKEMLEYYRKKKER